MGEDTDKVLATTNITAEQKKKYSNVVQKFDEFFKLADESAEQFIARLHQLTEIVNLSI